MSARAIMDFTLNLPQAKAALVMANETWCPWGRGTGKTQGVIAPWILHKVKHMPRSNGGLIGKSFTDLETKILQPIFMAFEMLGFEKDIHYVYGKRPPDYYARPLTPIIDYSHVLSFPNGTTMELISLHVKGSANGKSLQWLVGDEAKYLNENQLREEVFPILRGHVRHFGASPWYGAKLFVTDKLSPSIHWILAKKKLMDQDMVNTVIYYQLVVNGLIASLIETPDSQVAGVKAKISKIEKLLAVLRKDLVYYSEASAYENLENLSQDYIDNMKRSLTPYEFGISINNEDPTRAENGYYPDRTEEHLHDNDFDEDIMMPMGVTLDYQASISPLIAFQLNDLVIPGVKSLNFLHSMYVLQPLGLKDVVDKFCDHYKDRPCKHVYYFYDHTANAVRNTHKKYYEEVVSYFELNHWEVTCYYMGGAPLQGIKFLRLQRFFQNTNNEYFQTRIHRHRCASMVLAMDQTGTKHTDQGTQKDKSSEKKDNFPQEQSTHLPDAFDMAEWAVNEMNLYPSYVSAPMFVGTR